MQGECEFPVSTLFNFTVNLLYTIAAVLIAVFSLKVIDKVLLGRRNLLA